VSANSAEWYKNVAMKDNPHWMELCQQASVEEDPEKMMELIREINRLLDDKEERLKRESPKKG
jgi:hypothetical protein